MYRPQHSKYFNIHLPLEVLSIIIFFADTPTKIAFSLTSKTTQRVVFTIYENQMHTQLSKYMTPDVQQEFWKLLDETDSLIIGSVPMYMIFPSVTISSLDLAAPKALSPAWNNFFINQGYKETDSLNEVKINSFKPILMLKKEVNIF